MSSYGPIQKEHVSRFFYELENKIRLCKAMADEDRGDSDVDSIDGDVALMQDDLDRIRPLLAR